MSFCQPGLGLQCHLWRAINPKVQTVSDWKFLFCTLILGSITGKNFRKIWDGGLHGLDDLTCIYPARIKLFYNCNNKTLHYICDTTILLRELQTPSYLVLWNFTKYLRKVFETALNDYICLAECGKIYKPDFPRKDRTVCVKTISKSISCNVSDFFYLKSTQREIGHSKGTWTHGHLKST